MTRVSEPLTVMVLADAPATTQSAAAKVMLRMQFFMVFVSFPDSDGFNVKMYATFVLVLELPHNVCQKVADETPRTGWVWVDQLRVEVRDAQSQRVIRRVAGFDNVTANVGATAISRARPRESSVRLLHFIERSEIVIRQLLIPRIGA